MTRAFRFLVALAGLASSVAADVVVVDPGGQPGLPVLQAAVDAAADGDILLVRDGDYPDLISRLVIDGKAIHLVADEGGAPVEIGAVSITHVPAGRTADLRGFVIEPGILLLGDFPGVNVEDCAGAVWIEECSLSGVGVGPVGFGSSQPSPPAVKVSNCAAVTLVRSVLVGAKGPDAIIIGPAGSTPANAGGSGLDVVDGHVAVYDCDLMGGPPGDGPTWITVDGGHGLEAAGVSDVLLSDCSLRGADEGEEVGAMAGLHVAARGPIVRLLSSRSFGGLQGGQHVPAIDAPPGALVTWPIPARGVEVTSPRRVGESGTLTLTGVPGDIVAYFLSPNGGYLPLDANLSVLSLGNPLVGPAILGVMPPGGELQIGFVMPPLAVPATMGQAFQVQIIVQDTSGLVILGGGGSVHQIDAGL